MLEKLDLTKRFPGYFTKWVFRAGFIIMALVFLFVWGADGFSFDPHVTVECDPHGDRCLNALYVCSQVNYDPFYLERLSNHRIENCDGVEKLCRRNPRLCEVEWLEPGEVLGEPLSFPSSPFLIMMFSLMFAANHGLWMLKGGKKP